jgi:hypothetical protein
VSAASSYPITAKEIAAMKFVPTILSTLTLTICSLSTAFASGSPGDVDTSLTYNSGILVLAFAGFLALVVVVQLIPAAVTLYGMIRGAATEGKERQAMVVKAGK